ncbi:hypothetical protein DFJ63DRAFT_311550 [Scheffersomyces coipomensis]|uniref:uncharacterized protein n=1 Tax=Scheffersomyces coipomensis TaxID=1788519 RepID=UPI00315CA772
MKIPFIIGIIISLKLIYAITSDVTPYIKEFDDTNIAPTLEKSRYSFIYFYSDSCGYCVKFNPDFENLSLLYNSNQSSNTIPDIQILKTNARANKRVSQLFSINRYPSLRLLDFNTKEIFNYDKDKRDLPSLIEFIQQRVPDAVPDYNHFQSNVNYLDDSNFDLATTKPNSLVIFTLSFLLDWKDYHYPNHPYQRLTHHESFQHINFSLVDVDNVNIQNTIAKYHISNFPSLIYFKDNHHFKIYNSFSQNHVTRNNLSVNDIETFLNNLDSDDVQFGTWYDSISSLQKDIVTNMNANAPQQYGKKGFNVNQSQNIIQLEDLDDEYDDVLNHIEL